MEGIIISPFSFGVWHWEFLEVSICKFTHLGRFVQELDEEERKIWNDKAKEAMEAYQKELEEYNKSAATISDKPQQWRMWSAVDVQVVMLNIK